MSSRSKKYTSTKRLLAGATIALVGLGTFLSTTPASAAAAVFFPRGSRARVDRHHVTLSLSANGTVAWDAVDIGGDGTADVGLLVAVRAGGRIEVTGRAWIDLIEEATRVNVSIVPSSSCNPIGPPAANGSGDVEAGARGSVDGKASGGCNGDTSKSSDSKSGGGCESSSSNSNDGCGGCDSCEPSDNGHPGCSAIGMSTTSSNMGCGPIDPNDPGGSSGSTPRPNDGPSVGPYEMTKVSAKDGSALRWLEDGGYDPGLSFEEGAAAVERDGYELFAVRARPPASSSVVQSLRVVTTSAQQTLPLRMLRLGTSSPVTPLTLVVLASAPQELAATSVMQIDPLLLTSAGAASNYESLVSALLDGTANSADGGDAGATDGGARTSRWLFESAREVSNRPSTLTSDEGGAGSSATFADIFRAKCGEKRSVKHAVCTQSDDEVLPEDAGAGDADPGDASASSDSGTTPDAGDPDASVDASTLTCSDVDRQRCDDLDLAVGSGRAVIATRYRGLIGGDPALIADLRFAAAAGPLPDGRYAVRNDGQPGLCDLPSVGSDDPTTNDGETQACRQSARRPRPRSGLNLGPLVTLLLAIRAVTFVMKHAKQSGTAKH